jgi:hypothetical protein
MQVNHGLKRPILLTLEPDSHFLRHVVCVDVGLYTSGARNTEWSVLNSTEILLRVLYCIEVYFYSLY